MGFDVHHIGNCTRDIYRRGQVVGRIRGRTIELHGFWSRAEAERAMTAVSTALDRWLQWQGDRSGVSEQPTISRLSSATGMLGFEITVPLGSTADQVLQVARVALHAAFDSGTRLARPQAAAADGSRASG